jgi:hypothetical protein
VTAGYKIVVDAVSHFSVDGRFVLLLFGYGVQRPQPQV